MMEVICAAVDTTYSVARPLMGRMNMTMIATGARKAFRNKMKSWYVIIGPYFSELN
jgi:hypothetical protein